MSRIYCSFTDTIKEVIGGFTMAQMIAIGAVALIAALLGFFIGAGALYAAGIKKGKLRGAREAVAFAKMRAEEQASGHKKELLEAQKRSEALHKEKEAALLAKQAELEQAERSKQQAEQVALEAQRSKQEAEQAALEAQRSKAEAEQAVLEAQRSKEEAERVAREAEEQVRVMRENEENAIVKERKTTIDRLDKSEILAYADCLADPLETTIYSRGGKDLPDSIRVGICTFMLVYERKGMVKLVLRLDKKTASALEKQFKLFTKAVYPKGGDWYRWILSSEVTDLAVVSATIDASYKYVYFGNYGEQGTALKPDYVNAEENRINEAILRYQDLPDRDFIVASDAAGKEGAAYSLYGKKEIAAYGKSLAPEYPVKVTETESDLSPSTLKVGKKAFLMAYEKDGVAKMIFRLSPEEWAQVKQKHPTAEISPFPKAKGYSWYVAYIDETFTSNGEVEEIIRSACAHVHGLS